MEEKPLVICRKCGNLRLLGKHCKVCRKVYDAEYKKKNVDKIIEYREKNKDKMAEYHSEYNKRNKDRKSKYRKEYNKRNKDRFREYREKNKDRITEYGAEYRKKNKDKLEEYRVEYNKKNNNRMSKYYAEYREKNKDRITEYGAEWRQKNPTYREKYNKSFVLYDSAMTVTLRIAEETRRDPDDSDLLQVRCTYCGKWFNPTNTMVSSRLQYINGNMTSENRLYCSDGCKKSCSIFKVRKYPRGFRQATANEVQPELRKMVFFRDNWECIKCGSGDNLHCHHIDPIKSNPIESADIDNCMTLCKGCHKEAHKAIGCRYVDLARC